MNDLVVMLAFATAIGSVFVINKIKTNIQVKKFKKLNLKCPKCGTLLQHEVFDIELDSKEATIGTTRFDHGVKYYHVMTCPKCYYTVKFEDVETLNKLIEMNKG